MADGPQSEAPLKFILEGTYYMRFRPTYATAANSVGLSVSMALSASGPRRRQTSLSRSVFCFNFS